MTGINWSSSDGSDWGLGISGGGWTFGIDYCSCGLFTDYCCGAFATASLSNCANVGHAGASWVASAVWTVAALFLLEYFGALQPEISLGLLG
ncbi:unnamed protein product [Urochloa humidicola]